MSRRGVPRRRAGSYACVANGGTIEVASNTKGVVATEGGRGRQRQFIKDQAATAVETETEDRLRVCWPAGWIRIRGGALKLGWERGH